MSSYSISNPQPFAFVFSSLDVTSNDLYQNKESLTATGFEPTTT